MSSCSTFKSCGINYEYVVFDFDSHAILCAAGVANDMPIFNSSNEAEFPSNRIDQNLTGVNLPWCQVFRWSHRHSTIVWVWLWFPIARHVTIRPPPIHIGLDSSTIRRYALPP